MRDPDGRRGDAGDREPAGRWRGRGAVAASIIAGLLIGGYFAASTDAGTSPSAGFLINAAVLIPAFWFPALRIGSAGEVVERWRSLGPWLLAWTLVWDLATAGVIGGRELFDDWWIVYPAGVLATAGLLALHGWIVDRVGAAGDGGGRSP